MRANHPLIVLGLVAAVVGGVSLAVTSSRSAPTDPLAVVPADATMIALARTAPLLASPLVGLVVGDASRALSQLGEACGLDAAEAIDRVAVFAWDEGDHSRLGLVAHTTVPPRELVACAGRALAADGVTARETELDGHAAIATASSVVALVSPALIAAGDEATVRRVLAVARDDAASITEDTALTALVDAARQHGHDDAAFVGAVSDDVRERVIRRAPMLGPLFEAPRVAVGASLRGSSRFRVLVEAGDAERRAAALRQRIGAAAASESPLAGALARSEVTVNGSLVAVSLEITPADLEALAQ